MKYCSFFFSSFFFLHQRQLPDNGSLISQRIRRHGSCEILSSGYFVCSCQDLNTQQASDSHVQRGRARLLRSGPSFTLIYLLNAHMSTARTVDKCRQKENRTHERWMDAFPRCMLHCLFRAASLFCFVFVVKDKDNTTLGTNVLKSKFALCWEGQEVLAYSKEASSYEITCCILLMQCEGIAHYSAA